jgi:hypothetical protein
VKQIKQKNMRKIFIIDNKKALLTTNNVESGNISQIHELNELEETAINRMSADEDLFAYCDENNKWSFKISTYDDMTEMFDVISHLGMKMSYMKVEIII